MWPAQSPYLILCDFYLWGSLKDKVCKSKPHTLKQLKNNTIQEPTKTSEADLQNVFHIHQCEMLRYYKASAI
jgi:hypothetical protein